MSQNDQCLSRQAVEGLAETIGDSEAHSYYMSGPLPDDRAFACVATGWRADWLRSLLRLLDDATEKAVVDLKRDKESALDAAVRKTLQPPGEEK